MGDSDLYLATYEKKGEVSLSLINSNGEQFIANIGYWSDNGCKINEELLQDEKKGGN